MGSIPTPLSNSGEPKVYLARAVSGSMPTVPRKRPRHADISPFIREPVVSVETMESPKTANQKNSEGPNFREISARGGGQQQERDGAEYPAKRGSGDPQFECPDPLPPFNVMG